MSKRKPWQKFWTTDFSKAVEGWPLEAIGLYLMMLIENWEGRGVPIRASAAPEIRIRKRDAEKEHLVAIYWLRRHSRPTLLGPDWSETGQKLAESGLISGWRLIRNKFVENDGKLWNKRYLRDCGSLGMPDASDARGKKQ